MDCILDNGGALAPIEIKSGETFSSDFFANLTKWNQLAENDPSNSYVIYGGREKQSIIPYTKNTGEYILIIVHRAVYYALEHMFNHKSLEELLRTNWKW